MPCRLYELLYLYSFFPMLLQRLGESFKKKSSSQETDGQSKRVSRKRRTTFISKTGSGTFPVSGHHLIKNLNARRRLRTPMLSFEGMIAKSSNISKYSSGCKCTAYLITFASRRMLQLPMTLILI